MKKKRFYNNKERNQNWTQTPTGRKIDFADKYSQDMGTSKYDPHVSVKKKQKQTKEEKRLTWQRVGIVLGCILIVYLGYIIMDVTMQRNSMPATRPSESVFSTISEIKLEVYSYAAESLTMDGAVMLDAVMADTYDDGYSSVTFDLKRQDGTIGYNSTLATIDMIGGISSPAKDLETSVAKLQNNDILPIGRVVCYKDNMLPSKDTSAALMLTDSLYKDNEGNTYLDPNSETAYNYLRGIIEEASGYGLRVFILADTELPKECDSVENADFDSLVDKLSSDLGTDIKFLKPLDIVLREENTDKLKEEIEKKMDATLGNNDIYYVRCTEENRGQVKQILDNDGYTSYVIA